MTKFNNANLAKTKLVEDKGSTIVVEDSTGFPNVPFKIVITDTKINLKLSDIEIIEVNSVNLEFNEFSNLVRGAEDTEEKLWEENAYVENRMTAGIVDNIYNNIAEVKDENPDYTIHRTTQEPTAEDGEVGDIWLVYQ